MKSFYANHISCSQDDDVLSIGLADDEFDPIDFVILSRFADLIALPINRLDF